MKNLVYATVIALLCSACAILPEQVEVAYKPDGSVLRQRVEGSPEVRLVVADVRRPESPAWIADKKNGYGMRMASVVAQRPVAELVQDALLQELAALGVRVGEGRAVIAIDISRLESVFQIRFLTIGATGHADVAVQVRRADGSIAYARTFSVMNDDEAGLAGTAGQARRSVEAALAKIVGQIVSDPAFVGALADRRFPTT